MGIDVLRFLNKEGGKCPACNAYDRPKGGILVRYSTGWTVRCNRYPDCKYQIVHKTSRKARENLKRRTDLTRTELE